MRRRCCASSSAAGALPPFEFRDVQQFGDDMRLILKLKKH